MGLPGPGPCQYVKVRRIGTIWGFFDNKLAIRSWRDRTVTVDHDNAYSILKGHSVAARTPTMRICCYY